jgi:hypothetical protein
MVNDFNLSLLLGNTLMLKAKLVAGSIAKLTATTWVLAAMAAGWASTAAARGIAIDQVQPAPIAACALGAACAPNSFNGVYDFNFFGPPDPSVNPAFNLGVFKNLYVYADGVISFGKPLPAGASLASGLGSLGGNYIAAGFANLPSYNSAGDFEVTGSVDPTLTPDGSALVAQMVNVEWIFDTPDGHASILGVTLTDLSDIAPGDIGVSIDSGADNTTWFAKNYPNAYCDALCTANFDSGFYYEGVYLPAGTQIASGFKGFGPPVSVNSDFSYPGYFFTINVDAVPEPASWALAIVGFMMLGRQIRRRRLARGAA